MEDRIVRRKQSKFIRDDIQHQENGNTEKAFRGQGQISPKAANQCGLLKRGDFCFHMPKQLCTMDRDSKSLSFFLFLSETKPV